VKCVFRDRRGTEPDDAGSFHEWRHPSLRLPVSPCHSHSLKSIPFSPFLPFMCLFATLPSLQNPEKQPSHLLSSTLNSAQEGRASPNGWRGQRSSYREGPDLSRQIMGCRMAGGWCQVGTQASRTIGEAQPGVRMWENLQGEP
jgi:hypothetical protein